MEGVALWWGGTLGYCRRGLSEADDMAFALLALCRRGGEEKGTRVGVGASGGKGETTGAEPLGRRAATGNWQWSSKPARHMHSQPLNLVGRAHAHRGNCRLQEKPPRAHGEVGEREGRAQGARTRAPRLPPPSPRTGRPAALGRPPARDFTIH
jgi:hypothetical protein